MEKFNLHLIVSAVCIVNEKMQVMVAVVSSQLIGVGFQVFQFNKLNFISRKNGLPFVFRNLLYTI